MRQVVAISEAGASPSTADGIAVFTIDHRPVNALSQGIRAALLQKAQSVGADPTIRALIIHGAGPHFVAGADVREFDHEPLEPLLNHVLLKLEALKVPVIAALHGAVLGGGLELALACHYRCATADLSLGFPEIKLGLLPGAGGTQRMPRLIGVEATLELMLSGAPIDFERACEWGIVDREIRGDVLEGAQQYARELAQKSARARPLRERPVERTSVDPKNRMGPRTGIAQHPPALLAPAYIVECVEASATQPFDVALALSRRRFEECRVSAASRALRHLFFAERPKNDPSWPAGRRVGTVAVVGAGTMGSGITMALATAGLSVTLIDPSQVALEGGMSRIQQNLNALVSKGRLTPAGATAVRESVSTGSDLGMAADVDLVIEAVFENLAVKQDVFRALDGVCSAATMFASNTSTLDIDAIASATARPQAVVGMHFFSPAHVMRLVEIVRGQATSAETLATAAAVTRKMGKLGIVVGNAFGFVGNRMLYAYGRESQFLLLEGASPTQVDAALTEFGMAMGPNAVGDLAGLDVGYRVRRERKDLPSDPRYYRVADLLVEAGRLGQKTGRGAFRYAADSREPNADPEVDILIAAEAARLGIKRHPIANAEIVERCIFALINEGAKLLGEGIAETSADIDAIWCNGYGFPRVQGGPMFYADGLGLRQVTAGIERFGKLLGESVWKVAPLLRELARAGGSFSDWDRTRAASDHREGAAG